MIQGVRRPDEISGLGLGNRLLVRVGALLKKNLAVSRLLLEAALPGSPVETLLLDASLLETGGKTDALLLASLVSKSSVRNLGPLTIIDAPDGMRVLCLQEEIDAGDDWGSSAQTPALAVQPPASALAPVETSSGHADRDAFFSRGDMDRWRMRLMTASSASERMEALRTLALAPLSTPEKIDVLLHGLSDKENAVRAEAASLLPVAGGDRDVSESLAALNHDDPARRQTAVERLPKLLRNSVREVDIAAVAVCALSTLKTENDAALMSRTLELLRACAPALSRSETRLHDVARVLGSLVAAAAKHGASSRELENVLGPAHKLLAALGIAAPQALVPVLFSEHERCSEPVFEALLLQLLLDLAPKGDAAEDKLLGLCTAFLGRDVDEGRDSRAVGSRLARRGEKSMLALCQAFPKAGSNAQKYFLLLFDDIWRARAVSPAALERAAMLLLKSLESGAKGLRFSAMQCRFVTDMCLPEPLRARLTEQLLNGVSDFVFPFDIEKVESSISRMGLPAFKPLLDRLSAERAPPERVRAVRLLGELALGLKAGRGDMARLQDAVTLALRRVQELSLETEFPDRGELLCALGKLISTPAASKEAGDVIERTLLEASASSDAKTRARALEGLIHLAASRRAQAELIGETFALLKKMLDEMVFDIGMDSTRVRGETVIEITGGESYTAQLPIVLRGMSMLGCSPNCPPHILKELTLMLISRWRKVCRAELIWGPTNSMLLIQGLKNMGCCRALPMELRMEVLKSLAPKLSQTAVMRALTEILAADDSIGTSTGALTIGFALMGRKGPDGQFPAEDREDILKALSRIAGRKILGGLGASDAQEKSRNLRKFLIEELFKGLSDLVPNCYEMLTALRDKNVLPTAMREDLERRLREYHSIVLTTR
jgi:hypothetical protein